MFIIRPERAEDGPAIESLLDQAFGPARYDRVSYRYRDGVLPDAALSHVATSARGFIVATIRYWPVALGPRSCPALLLGPLAVTGACQGRGVGAALVRATLTLATAAGYKRVLLVGDLAYYKRFGFASAAAHGLVMPDEDPQRLLACTLVNNAFDGVTGEVRRWRSVRRRSALQRAA
jgi:predicted N-acetyltransferase YhbS